MRPNVCSQPANKRSELDCGDEILAFPAGSFDIEQLQFKSIRCEASVEIVGN